MKLYYTYFIFRQILSVDCISSRQLRRRLKQEVFNVIHESRVENSRDEKSNLLYGPSADKVLDEYSYGVKNIDSNEQNVNIENNNVDFINNSVENNVDFTNNSVENNNLDFINDIGSEDFLTENINKKDICDNNYANINDLIAVWAVEEHIPHVSLTKLLKILKIHRCHKDYPSDARTLLQTPRSTIIKNVEKGVYHHFGLKKSLMQFLNLNKNFVLNENEIKICINVDGLPLSKSSNSQLWPILGSVYKTNNVFLIGVYYSNISNQRT